MKKLLLALFVSLAIPIQGAQIVKTPTEYQVPSSLTIDLGVPLLGTWDFSAATVLGITTLPTQTGNAGKFLTTNGSIAAWANIAESDVTNLVSDLAGKQASLGSAPAVSWFGNPTTATATATFNTSLIPLALIPTATATGTQLISGGGVAWTGGLNFTASAAVYLIAGTQYSSPQTNVTLGAADATFDRIDIIAVNTSGAVVVIPGTPAAVPAAPNVDPVTQLQLTFAYIAANATVPTGTANENIYLENVEYTSSTNSAGTINLASTLNPFAGTKDIEVTNGASGNLFTLLKPSGNLNLSNYTSLIFNIRSKASWPGPKSLAVFWMSGASQVGATVALKTGVLGFDSSNTTTYQQIVIPTASFGAGATTVDRLRFSVAGGGGTIGLYVDNIILQGNTGGGGGGGGTGDVSSNTTTSVDGEAAVFRGTNGKVIGRYALTGIVQATNGVLSSAVAADATHNGYLTSTDWTTFNTSATTGVSDTAFASTWDGVTTIAPSENAVYDALSHSVTFVVDGSGAVLTTGTKSYVKIPFGGTLQGWSLIGSPASSSVTCDIYRAANAAGLPTTSIVGGSGTKPALSSAVENSSTSFTSWTSTTLNANDNLAINLSGITTCTYLSLTLYYK